MKSVNHHDGSDPHPTPYRGDGSAEDILRWALDAFHPRIALATSLQDGVLIHLATRIRKDVRVFSIDTGRLPEETYRCAEALQQRYGIRIEWYFPRYAEVERITTGKGPFSFKQSLEDRRECCFVRKVEPLNRALQGLDAWITGQRREESVTRAALPAIAKDEAHGGLWKINPIANWTSDDVRDFIRRHDIPYNQLLDRGYASIGCACCTRAVDVGEHPRSGRWWWEEPEHKECGLHVRNWDI